MTRRLRNGLLALALVIVTPSAFAWEGGTPTSDPSKPGNYLVGHATYVLSNQTAYDRPVAVSVWYPVDTHTINSKTPLAQYPLDLYSNNLPVSTSADWEPFGYDRAYEGPQPSHDGPFPLILMSGAWGGSAYFYNFIGTRVASHGFVIAVIEHFGDWQWPWATGDDWIVTMFNRAGDASFAITELLRKSGVRGELLHRTIDPSRIALGGHSLGGYVADAFAAGDDALCDSLLATGGQPEPDYACVPEPRDPRIKAIFTLDGSSWALRYRELARIRIPSLFMGETVENSAANGPVETWIARPHAAVDRRDSYRVDIKGTNHYSWTAYCDGFRVMDELGALEPLYGVDLATVESWWPCGPDAATISTADAQEIVATYAVAFLSTYLRADDDRFSHVNDAWVLTPGYARHNQPQVEFFHSEECHAVLPSGAYFTYRPHPGECNVAVKDPSDYFEP